MATKTATRKTRMSDAQRTAYLKERSDKLEALSTAVNEAMESGDFDYDTLLEGRYSPRNTLLILQQIPDATVVRGYGQWQDEGRQVRRGEHGAQIFRVVKGEVPEDAPEGTKGRSYMKTLTVFDISQTDPMTPEQIAARKTRQTDDAE